MEISELKQSVFQAIDGERDAVIERGRRFFHCAEPGFHEHRTAEMIGALLDEWGVPYEKHTALTGIIARIGSGRYRIGITADIDALPKKEGSGFIHSCGHSIQTANLLTVLKALLPFQNDPGFDGTLEFFFTPAEELTDPEERDRMFREGTILGRSGKQHMIADGDFDGISCVLSSHASADPARTFNVDSVLTGFLTKRVTMRGKAAHSGAEPHAGKNALHGAMLALNGIAFLKDRFAPEEGVSIHPVIRDISGGINIIPEEAVIETYIRALTGDALERASELFDTCVKGCADALGLEVSTETRPGYLPLHQDKKLCEVAASNMRLFVDDRHVIRAPVSGASGDIGDLGSLIPSIQYGFSGIKGQFHTDHFEVEDEEFCYLTAAKVLAGTAVDLLADPLKRPGTDGVSMSKEEYLVHWLDREEDRKLCGR